MGAWSRIASRVSVGNVRAKDVVGVPVMPPAGITAGVERLRAAIGKIHRDVVPPPVQILDAMLAPLDAVVLGAICRLGVPAELRRSVDLDQLARRCAVEPDRLARLVRFAHARGWLRLDRRGRVHATRVTRFLRREHPGEWRGWVEFASQPEILRALAELSADPRVADPFAVANGASFFAWTAAEPQRQAAFDGAMAAGARMHGLGLVSALDWSGVRRVCDVGGGTGELLAVVVDAYPNIDGVIVEIPSVAGRIEPRARITVRAEDAFEFAEPDCDRYLLVNVLHDWDDDDAVRLLANVRRIAPPRCEVLVVESERRARPRSGTALSTDLLMLALTPGGRERTTSEISKLAQRSGWTHHKRVGLPSGDFVHRLVPTTR